MGIIVKTKATVTSVEASCTLTLYRHRPDIQKLLEELKQGVSITSLFKPTIATSVLNLLKKNKLADINSAVSAKGEEFIKYPYLLEEERGIYNLNIYDVQLSTNSFGFIPFFERRLSDQERSKSKFDCTGVLGLNECRIGKEETAVFREAQPNSEGYVAAEGQKDVTFDIYDEVYDAGYGNLILGSNLREKLTDYVVAKIKELDKDLIYDEGEKRFIVTDFSSLTDRDIKYGLITKKQYENIYVTDVPFAVNNQEDAQKYAYMYMYYLLTDDKFYSLKEMNEIFENEVLSKSVIPDSLKAGFFGFSYSLDGFKKYLPKEKYDNLSYRLNVVKTLLDIDNLKDQYGFSNTRNYSQFADQLGRVISSYDVKKLFIVTGYAFAKTEKNKIVECVKNLKAKYSNVVVVNKTPESRMKIDPELLKQVKCMGVQVINKPEICDVFHDRLLVFELNNGTYTSLLCTCEVGQFYNISTDEPMGSVINIDNTELIKNGKNIISMIKE